MEKLNTHIQYEQLLEQFHNFLTQMIEDETLMEPDQPLIRELVKECFRVQNEQIKYLQS